MVSGNLPCPAPVKDLISGISSFFIVFKEEEKRRRMKGSNLANATLYLVVVVHSTRDQIHFHADEQVTSGRPLSTLSNATTFVDST